MRGASRRAPESCSQQLYKALLRKAKGALVLKHVGVVFQTMYLAATAMGLAPCAVGLGDSDLFAQAADTDYYAETSVGEFLHGSAPAS